MSSSSSVSQHKVGHHFRSATEEFDSAKLGMWLFLATEVLLFGGLFCAYLVFRSMHPAAFTEGSHALNWKMGGFNTLVLITSSFTMAWAVRLAQLGDNKKLIPTILFTLACGAIFMVVKYFEYTHKIHMGTLWAGSFTAQGFTDPRVPVFFGLYFLMTGLHGLHVIIGMSLMVWLLVKAVRGHFSPEYFTPVEMVGLYWHLVDLIWIFLFPLFYLVSGVHL